MIRRLNYFAVGKKESAVSEDEDNKKWEPGLGGPESGEPGVSGAMTEGAPQSWPLFYEVHVFCCVNERAPKHRRGSCTAKGSRQLCDYMCRRAMAMGLRDVRINQAGCLNRCEMGPCMVIYPKGLWYRFTCEADIDDILRYEVKKGVPVQRLLLRPDEGPKH